MSESMFSSSASDVAELVAEAENLARDAVEVATGVWLVDAVGRQFNSAVLFNRLAAFPPCDFAAIRCFDEAATQRIQYMVGVSKAKARNSIKLLLPEFVADPLPELVILTVAQWALILKRMLEILCPARIWTAELKLATTASSPEEASLQLSAKLDGMIVRKWEIQQAGWVHSDFARECRPAPEGFQLREVVSVYQGPVALRQDRVVFLAVASGAKLPDLILSHEGALTPSALAASLQKNVPESFVPHVYVWGTTPAIQPLEAWIPLKLFMKLNSEKPQ